MVWTIGLGGLKKPIVSLKKRFALLGRERKDSWITYFKTKVEKMAKKPETWCFVITFIFTLLAIKPKGFQHVDPIPQPRHIFQKGSPVHEFIDGDMLAVQELLKHRELDYVMVMFYAHWDGTSVNAALEFEEVARHPSSVNVTFLAVNCWWPYGACAHYRALNYYPMITVIHQTLGELEYTGVFKAESMLVFLRRIMNPFTYIADESILRIFSAEHEVSVIGYFNFSLNSNGNYSDPQGFVSFVKASIRAVVKDPINPIPFGIVTTDRLARRLLLTHPKDIMLRRQLNVSLVYPRNFSYNSKLITSWAYKNQQKAVPWLVPTQRKSLIFSNIFSKGPTLLMFTPHEEENRFDNNYHLLRSLVLDYANCKNSSSIWESIRTIHSEKHKHRKHQNKAEFIDDSINIDCCSTLSNYQQIEYLKTSRFNTCELCEHSTEHGDFTNACNINSAGILKSLESFGVNIFNGPESCLNWLNNYNPFCKIRVCCKKADTIGAKVHSRNTFLHTCNCKNDVFNYNSKKLSANTFRNKVLHIDEDVHMWSEITGLGCRTNKSLAFYCIHSDMFSSLADHLGLDGTSISVVIIDLKNEMQHVLPTASELSVNSLRTFILNYTNSNLDRYLKSSSRLAAVKTPNIDSTLQDSKSNIFIQEVTTDTFDQIVLNNTQDVMLLYYTPWCGYCFRIYHLYLNFANLLQNLGLHRILVSRIDGDANDLPWQFTVSTYPTIIFFPVGQSNNSIKLPEKQQITLLSLVKFTLKHTTQSI